VNLSHKSLKKLQKINKLIFSTFIQLKMRHEYFKSYLHQLSQNNSNKCYEICTASQTSEHLLLKCKHYRSKQMKLKKKARKHRYYINTVYHQSWQNCNIKVFEKYLNCNQKMTFRNERLRNEICERKNEKESTIEILNYRARMHILLMWLLNEKI